MKDNNQSNIAKKDDTDNATPAQASGAASRTLASSPLILSLLIVLLGAVCVQGIALISIASKDRDAVITPLASEPDGGLVARPEAASPATGPTPASRLATAPMGSLLTDDFLSDDWQPFAEMARMREQMDRLFEGSFQRFRSMPGFDDAWLADGAPAEPAITDKGDHFLVKLDLPGADESTLEIRLENDVLTVSGQRQEKSEERDQAGNIIAKSTSTSSFQRSLSLPDPTDVTGLQSNYENNLLTIKIPKKAPDS